MTHPRPHDIEQQHKDHSWGLRLLVWVLCPAPTPEPAEGCGSEEALTQARQSGLLVACQSQRRS